MVGCAYVKVFATKKGFAQLCAPEAFSRKPCENQLDVISSITLNNFNLMWAGDVQLGPCDAETHWTSLFDIIGRPRFTTGPSIGRQIGPTPSTFFRSIFIQTT